MLPASAGLQGAGTTRQTLASDVRTSALGLWALEHWLDMLGGVGLRSCSAARDEVGMLPTGYDKDAAE